MKSLLKKLLMYDRLFPLIRKSAVYHRYKKGIAQLASALNGNPSSQFTIIGVTGTDGKTTTCNLLHSIINENLGKTVMISTATIRIGDESSTNKTKMTSLDAFQLQSLLALAKDQGCTHAILEVSSHGLEQYRFEGIEFDGAILTNITPEHLDYHGNMENYAATKKVLFQKVVENQKNQKLAVFNRDSEYGRKRSESMSFDTALTYGINGSASLKAENIVVSLTGTTFQVNYLGKIYQVTTTLLGYHNVANILAALGMAIALGIDIQKAIATIQTFEGVQGRLEPIKINDVLYFIDFAHTPNALESTLSFFHEIKGKGKLIVVFGATGQRDRYKRPLMGSLVEKYADVIIATDDDAGTEPRYQILKELTKSINRKLGDNYVVLPEREFALKYAMDVAQPGDFVICAGKGHEQVQITNFGKRKRNDKDKLVEFAKERGAKIQEVSNQTVTDKERLS